MFINEPSFKLIKRPGLYLFLLVLLTCPIRSFANANLQPEPPLLNQWESNMINYGSKWGKYVTQSSLSFKQQLDATYYDQEKIFYLIANYTNHDKPWLKYAEASQHIYLDKYLIPNNFKIPGYMRFPHGLYFSYKHNPRPTIKSALKNIRDLPAFSDVLTSPWAYNWKYEKFSREIAYAINSQILAERAGYPRNDEKLNRYINFSLNHIHEWLTQEYGNTKDEDNRFAPFMFALTAEALIGYYEWEKELGNKPNETIPQAIKSLADYLWTQAKVTSGPNKGKSMWVEDIGGSPGSWNDAGGTGFGAFRYEDKNQAKPAPDLNLLIAPIYAWLFMHYGDIEDIHRGDLLWASGVALSSIGYSSKIFNQNYRWSFDYLKWRKEGISNLKLK